MRSYRALLRATAKSVLAYRMAFVLSIFGVLFQLVAMLAVWRAILSDSTTTSFTWPQMRGYLFVAFACGALVGLLTDFGMALRIQSGMVALDLIKPVRYQEARFVEVLGAAWIEAVVVLVVGVAVSLTGGGLPWPGGGQLALFAASMLLMIPLKFIVLYLSGMACFWTQNFIGVQWARIAIVNLLSGALVPLSYLPHWLDRAAFWSPFAAMASTPGLILVGRVDGIEALRLLAIELGWLVVLWFGAKLLWRVAVRQLTVNGG